MLFEDAFEIFDEDQSGFVDEDEYRYAMEYLGIDITDEKLEKHFHRYDYNFSGIIDYNEFRYIFLEICDLRKELELRRVDVPTFIRKSTLRRMLRDLILEEERKERRALVKFTVFS